MSDWIDLTPPGWPGWQCPTCPRVRQQTFTYTRVDGELTRAARTCVCGTRVEPDLAIIPRWLLHRHA